MKATIKLGPLTDKTPVAAPAPAPVVGLDVHGLGQRWVAGESIRKLGREVGLAASNPHKTLSARANAKAEKGDFAGAITDLSQAIDLQPGFAPAWASLGCARAVTGDFQGGIADLSRAIELEPDKSKQAEAFSNRGNAYGELGLLNKALQAQSQPGAGFTKDTLAHVHFLKALADTTRAVELNPGCAQFRYARGNVYLQLGQYDKAIADFSKAIDLEPAFVCAWQNRGATPALAGDLQSAEADFSKTIELDRRKASAYFSRGNVRQSKGDIDHAIADYANAVELERRFLDQCPWLMFARPGLQPILAKLLGELPGTAGGNVIVVEEARIRSGGQVVDTVPRGTVLEVRGAEGDALRVRFRRPGAIQRKDVMGLDDAIGHFTEVIRRDPHNAGAYSARGNARTWTDNADYGKALADHNEAIRVNPENAAGYHHRAFAWALKGELQKAIADLNKARSLVPKEAMIFSDRGRTWQMAGDYQAALMDFNEALNLDPQYSVAYRNRASVWYQNGNDESALADFGEAFRLDAEDVATLWGRAMCWSRSGNMEEWISNVSAAVDLNPKFVRSVLGCSSSALPPAGPASEHSR